VTREDKFPPRRDNNIQIMSNIYLDTLNLSKDADHLVLATVIQTRGSAPQKAGASALFGKQGLLAGTVGGGLLEGKVQEIAVKLAGSRRNGIFHFDLDREIRDKSEAICGGQVDVLIEDGMARYSRLFVLGQELLKERLPFVLVTNLSPKDDGTVDIERKIVAGNDTGNETDEATRLHIVKMLREAGSSGFICTGRFSKEKVTGDLILLESVFPLPRLIIAGAGHIGKALSHLGRILDFEVIVADDREEYANTRNLPDAFKIIVGDIGKSVMNIGSYSDVYIVIVTRGHNDDGLALRACIKTDAKYIGMIGSRTKIEKMRKEFLANGWATEEEWKRIHAPVGLDIGSKSVTEIAISIAAELVMVRNKVRS